MPEMTIAGRTFEVSNLDKVLFPQDGITKGDIIDYYGRIAEWMLPRVASRPLVLQRFPDGIDASGFLQKNTPDHVPGWIRRVELTTEEGDTTTYSVVDDAAGLAYLANQAALALHTLLGDADDPSRPVEVIFDLDPSNDDVEPVRRAAASLRAVLDDVGLAPRVKSSGSRGLHVIVEVLDDKADFDLTRRFARTVADDVAARGDFTQEVRKTKRQGRLFIDVLRNAPANHAVAPWSLRAIAGAPIAAPLDWDEALDASFHPRRITLANVFRRMGQKHDPWADHPRPTSTIAAALDELTAG